MKHVIFITGTGTDVGKTIVTAALLRALRSRGLHAASMKPVQTGAFMLEGKWRAPDLDLHLEAANLEVSPETYALMAPYCYAPPCSPHLAGRMAGTYPEVDEIIRCAHALLEEYDCLLVEGAGGLLAPLDEGRTMLDLVQVLDCPTLVVATTGLGTINHSLLTLGALAAHHLPVLGMAFTHAEPLHAPDIMLDNPETIARLGDVPILGVLSYREETPRPWELWSKEFTGLDAIIEALR